MRRDTRTRLPPQLALVRFRTGNPRGSTHAPWWGRGVRTGHLQSQFSYQTRAAQHLWLFNYLKTMEKIRALRIFPKPLVIEIDCSTTYCPDSTFLRWNHRQSRAVAPPIRTVKRRKPVISAEPGGAIYRRGATCWRQTSDAKRTLLSG